MADPQITRIVLGLDDFIDEVTRAITVDVHAELVGGTPVDTGWARANWVPGIPTAPVSPVGQPDSVDRVAAATGIGQVLGAKRIQQAQISNNVPYIGSLNRGSSPQAQAGFIEEAIERGVRGAVRIRPR